MNLLERRRLVYCTHFILAIILPHNGRINLHRRSNRW